MQADNPGGESDTVFWLMVWAQRLDEARDAVVRRGDWNDPVSRAEHAALSGAILELARLAMSRYYTGGG